MRYLEVKGFFLFLIVLFSEPSIAQKSQTDFNTLKTFGTMGKQQSVLKPNVEAELFSYTGKGCLTHMWFGGAFKGYGQTRIRIYVDGEAISGIDMELLLGHGIGFNDESAPWGTARIGNTGGNSGIYNTYQIPFGKSIRVTAQLADGADTGQPFWWIIRGTENLPVEIAGVRLPDNARLKLYKLEKYTAKPFEEFNLCNVSGSGALYEVTMAAKGTPKTREPKDSWMSLSYLESCIRAYMNGEKNPLFLSSGLEDYFLGTYYFQKGKYYTPVAGLTHFDASKLEFSAYRFHDEDPVFFQKGFRLTNRCGEELGGFKFWDPTDTEYTTYVWLYQW